ncbi:MAG: hypothetical protein AAF512_03485 [Pseudomonadota bacterium]
MPPEQVADLVHDAIVEDKFWIFTDRSMVDTLRRRYDAILDDHNPDSGAFIQRD